jgi:hypothetical protein
MPVSGTLAVSAGGCVCSSVQLASSSSNATTSSVVRVAINKYFDIGMSGLEGKSVNWVTFAPVFF